MKDRNDKIKNIIINVLDLMPDHTNIMYITLDDYDDMLKLQLEIKLNVKELDNEKDTKKS